MLTILHVVEEGSNDAFVLKDTFDRRSAYGHLLTGARAAVETIVSELTISRVDLNIVVEVGKASTVILQVAGRLRAGLLIIGISNRRSIRERIIGSTADRVIRTSFISVLVVKRPVKAPYRRVVAAIDFSPQAEVIVAVSSALLPHTRLKLVHVTDIPLQFLQALLHTGTSEEDINRYRHARLNFSRERLLQLATRLLKPGNYDIQVIEGEPAKMLVGLSRSRGVDVITMGAHGQAVIMEFFLGSITQKLLREAACDLLISPFSQTHAT